MPEGQRLIHLEIHGVGDALRGRVAAEDAPVREFHGWLGLLSALSALLDTPPENPPNRR